MPHHTPLIAMIVAGLGIAFVFGTIAYRLRLSPLVGYILAGVAVGPFTPGFVADQGLANELAEIGVILLMFGVGLHFSLKDLMSVRMVALPGALVQMAFATALGMGFGHLLGWPLMGGLIFGLSLSVASTVVLLRALQQRHILDSERGRIAVGWLIVEDLAMVLALVLIPALVGATHAEGSGSGWLLPLGVTLVKVGGFVAFMLIVGRRVIPWVLHYVAHTGSRELFRLAVLAIALGVAFGAASLFGVSFALGAFFAGMVLAESQLSHRAAEETLPLRDAFAVLFFVSVGMLFNPMIIFEHPWLVLATLAIIILGKAAIAYVLMRAFRRDHSTAAMVAASLAQIGEFSFILAGLGVSLGVLPSQGQDLILAGAILSIVINPLVWLTVGPGKPKAVSVPTRPIPVPTALVGHTVLVGFSSIGQAVAKGLSLRDTPFLLIDDVDGIHDRAQEAGYEIIQGNGADAQVLQAANVQAAAHLIITIPNSFESSRIAEQARRANPDINIVARAHSDAEVIYLEARGANHAILADSEIARAMLLMSGNLPPLMSEARLSAG